MSKTSHISIDKNDNIIIHDNTQGKIIIDLRDAEDIPEKLNSLKDELLDILAQITELEKGNVGKIFPIVISGLISQKNIVKGSISNIKGDVIIGDNNTRNYYYVEQRKTPKELTAQIPRLRQDQIIGRQGELNDLHNRLFNNKQVVLVNGMGGIGKTTLAQVYVSKYYKEYKHIAWISQLLDDVRSDFINAVGLLNGLEINTEGKKPQQLFEELIMALKKIEDKPCLMIIDNATVKLSDFYDFLPGQPNWHILVTSREQIPFFDLKELDFLNEKEAVALFRQYYTRNRISDEVLKDLVKRLEYHTLTIEILAKTAQEQRSTS